MSINITLFGQMIAFILLIWFVNKLLWGPVTNLLNERQKRISEGLSAAEKGKKDLELAEKRAKEILLEAKHQCTDITNLAKKQATEMVEEAKSLAREEAERIKAAGKAEIDQEVNRAREKLRKEVAAIAMLGASKVLRKEIDAKAHNQLLDDMARQI